MKIVMVVGAAILLAGCAATIKMEEHTVTVSTPGAEGAACKVSYYDKSLAYLPSTPASFPAPKYQGPLIVTCEKEGFETTSMRVPETPILIEGLMSGVILGVVGIFVDAGTGALWRYDEEVAIVMAPSADAAGQAGDAAPPSSALESVVAGMVRLSPLSVATGSAAVRAEPRHLGKVVRVVRMGQRLDLVDSDPSGWVQVAMDGEAIGWMHWTSFPVPRQTYRGGTVPRLN